jgi:hypothetical protein
MPVLPTTISSVAVTVETPFGKFSEYNAPELLHLYWSNPDATPLALMVPVNLIATGHAVIGPYGGEVIAAVTLTVCAEAGAIERSIAATIGAIGRTGKRILTP